MCPCVGLPELEETDDAGEDLSDPVGISGPLSWPRSLSLMDRCTFSKGREIQGEMEMSRNLQIILAFFWLYK